MKTLFLEVFLFSAPCWITNMSFQLIWAFLQKLGSGNPLSRLNDFAAIRLPNGQALEIKSLSLIPIILFPLYFNLFLPQGLGHYFLMTSLVGLGDLLGSLTKRLFGYPKGTFMPLVDHGDYLITAGLAFLCLGKISSAAFLCSLMLTYVLHPLACVVGYKLQLKKQPL